MEPNEQTKCAHPICTCPAAKDSKYCSPSCERVKDSLEIACNCEHQGCLAKAA